VSERRLFWDALNRGQGILRPVDLRQEMAVRERAGEYIERARSGPYDRPRNRRGAGDYRRDEARAENPKEGYSEGCWERLQPNPSSKNSMRQQWEGAYQVLTNQDRIQGIQGSAGAGRTTFLEPVIHELERAGYEVKDLASNTGAATRLGASGLAPDTLQKAGSRSSNYGGRGWRRRSSDAVVRPKSGWYQSRSPTWHRRFGEARRTHEIAGEKERIQAHCEAVPRVVSRARNRRESKAVIVTPNHASRNKLNAEVRLEMREVGELGGMNCSGWGPPSAQ